MQKIEFRPVYHNKQERIALVYAYDSQINKLTRTLPGAKWSQTLNCWHVPLNEEVCKKAIALLGPYGETQVSSLRSYLLSARPYKAHNQEKCLLN